MDLVAVGMTLKGTMDGLTVHGRYVCTSWGIILGIVVGVSVGEIDGSIVSESEGNVDGGCGYSSMVL